MVETIQRNGLWHITLAEKDLVEQAGLNQEDFEQDFGFFRYKGRAVVISHTFDEHLVVSMEGEDNGDMKSLMNGFSTVIGYQPFCKYIFTRIVEGGTSSMLTYEWDKVSPDGRYDELSSKQNISGLVRLL